jgi:hypothetical protein
MSERVHESPGKGTAEDGQVMQDGLDGVAISMTPGAARKTGKSLQDAADEAEAQNPSERGEPNVLREDEVISPGSLGEARPKASCLPDDADDNSDAGLPTTDHDNEGWRSVPISRP